MDSKPQGTDWRSILVLIFALSGTAITLSSAIGILVFLALNNSVIRQMDMSPLATVLLASTLIAIGLLLLPVAWLSLKRLRGQKFETFTFLPLRAWSWVVIPILWFLIITFATRFQNAPGAYWYIPVLHFLAIALPVYFVLRIAISHIPLSSSQRAWGVFSSGLTLSPLVAIIAEVTLMALAIGGFALYIGLTPEKMAEIERLVNQIEQAPDIDRMIYLVGPYLKSPLTLLAALTFLSLLVPIIEESAKTLGVWLVFSRISTPAQGFAMGVLSGAGFALAESLSASLTADEAWAVTLSVRAISGSMHMLASGLAGWGIAYARLEKRYVRMVGMLLLAMFLHSAWNAGAVFSVWGGARTMLAMPGVDFLGTLVALTGMGLLLALMVGMIVAFFVINRRLQPPASIPSPSAEVEDEAIS